MRRPASWRESTFVWALAGGVALYVAFPPCGLWPLAWVAPIPWLILVERPQWPGRRPWLALWAASAAHWLAMLQGIRLAHWANYFGWLALSLYIAVYLPVFIGLARVAVHQCRLPLLVAAPVVWTGLELARGHLITGFSMALLGHTQRDWVCLIQISDLFGAYGVSFLVMFGAACLTRMRPFAVRRSFLRPLILLVAAMTGVLGYGCYRLRFSAAASSRPATVRVALIQASVDKVFEYDPQRSIDTFLQYRGLALQARDRHPDLDLIVWPESVFTGVTPELLAEHGLLSSPHSALSDDERRYLERAIAAFEQKTQDTAARINRTVRGGQKRRLNIHQIVGHETVVYLGQGRFREHNAALLLDPSGKVAGRYYKMHPVMFGEYVPFGDVFPWLYRLTPLPQGLTPGDAPAAFDVRGIRFSPSICFESTVPHLIRRQVAELRRRGAPPDVLVNVTDDGWFWGSSILDFQATCAAFRAVELRRPFLVAANTGISAWIDGDGRIRQLSPRRTTHIIVADVRPDGRRSVYETLGDLPAGICLAACLAFAAAHFGSRWKTLAEPPEGCRGKEILRATRKSEPAGGSVKR